MTDNAEKHKNATYFAWYSEEGIGRAVMDSPVAMRLTFLESSRRADVKC